MLKLNLKIVLQRVSIGMQSGLYAFKLFYFRDLFFIIIATATLISGKSLGITYHVLKFFKASHPGILTRLCGHWTVPTFKKTSFSPRFWWIYLFLCLNLVFLSKIKAWTNTITVNWNCVCGTSRFGNKGAFENRVFQ